jgi:hypothetical protein
MRIYDMAKQMERAVVRANLKITRRHGTWGLVLRWNGSRWTQVATPDLGDFPGPNLSGVTTAPDGAVWAVGTFFKGGPQLSLAIRCS